MTICPLCQTEVFNFPEDQEYHDKEHAELMETIEPHVNPEFLKMVEAQGNLVHVDYSSPLTLQHELYMRGRIFKKELDLSGTYWFPNGKEDKNAHGFLFNDETGHYGNGSIIGGCVVRWEKYEGGPARWWLDWAWVNPNARQQGIFSRHLAKLSERFEGLQLQLYHLYERKLQKAALAAAREVSLQLLHVTQRQDWGYLRLPLRGSLEPIVRV